jgi:hypothetical protein
MDKNLTIEEQYEEIQNKYIRFFKIREPYPLQSSEFIELKDEVISNKETIQSLDEETQSLTQSDKSQSSEELEPVYVPLGLKQTCEICNGTYSHFNKKRHETTRKHLNALQALST